MPTRKRGALWSVALIVLLAIAAGAKLSAGQNGAETPVPEIPVINKSWPDVNLNVVVLDKHGVPQQVDEHQFQLFEDGAERPLRFRGSPDSPVSLALIIDSSGSIFKRKPAIVAAVTAIVKALPPDSEVMAVLFADQSFLDLPFTPVSKVDFSFLDRLQAWGGTTLYDTVFATERHFVAHAKYVRRAMVILSDGEDNASHVSRGTAFGAMEQPGAPVVYACPPSKARFMQNETMAGLINMKFLAKEGGGIDFNLDPDPASTAAQIAAAIRSQYVLQFTAADPARDGKKHKLVLRLPIKDVEIHAIPEYFAPAK
ncbi:MAG: VWA domain-containing protein [Terracidiphilus sp.]|jgi:VWFA-related protein